MPELPNFLSNDQATGIQENEPIAQFEIGNYRNFVYLILDWNSNPRQAAIVDPQYDLSLPLNALKKHGFTLTKILLTHTHFDHTAGVPDLVKIFPDVPLTVHELDLHRLDSGTRSKAKIQTVQDGQTLQIGHQSLRVMHTPGHSAGECCYFLEGKPSYLLTGDTVFIRDCGRTDLESGSTKEMFESLQKIRTLPVETVILPGHHYRDECASTLWHEIQNSPPFQCKTVEDLEKLP